MKKKTGSFYAISEMGDKYLILEYSNYINGKPSINQYWTSEGMAVYPIGDNLYVISQLDIILRRLFREPVGSAE